MSALQDTPATPPTAEEFERTTRMLPGRRRRARAAALAGVVSRRRGPSEPSPAIRSPHWSRSGACTSRRATCRAAWRRRRLRERVQRAIPASRPPLERSILTGGASNSPGATSRTTSSRAMSFSLYTSRSGSSQQARMLRLNDDGPPERAEAGDLQDPRRTGRRERCSGNVAASAEVLRTRRPLVGLVRLRRSRGIASRVRRARVVLAPPTHRVRTRRLGSWRSRSGGHSRRTQLPCSTSQSLRPVPVCSCGRRISGTTAPVPSPAIPGRRSRSED
jgi:hypothetical protein